MMNRSFSDLPQGCIYLIKGTLNQFAYEVDKLENTQILIEPNWQDIQQTISSNSIFIEHTYLITFSENKIPTNLYIGENKCYTLFILVSNFRGELNEHKKLFKSCHEPYYSLDILCKDYIQNKAEGYNLTSEVKLYFNLNPKIEISYDNVNICEENNLNLPHLLVTGDFSLWKRPNRSLFYKYLFSNSSCKYNFTTLDKPPYGIPISLWILFIMFCKEKSKIYNLHPEYLIKTFAVWVYLTTNYYKNRDAFGLDSFVNRRDNKKYYSFATSEIAMNGLKRIMKKC